MAKASPAGQRGTAGLMGVFAAFLFALLTQGEDMDEFKHVMAQAIDAATRGDVQALLLAQTLLSHLRSQLGA